MSNARDIRVIVSDVDGVWTDGKIIYAGDRHRGEELDVRDGPSGAELAQRSGITIVLLTSRRSPHSHAAHASSTSASCIRARRTSSRRARRSSEGSASRSNKRFTLATTSPTSPRCCAGLSAAPADAAPEVYAAARWKLESRGGDGAFRELVERLLRERGDWEAVVQGYR